MLIKIIHIDKVYVIGNATWKSLIELSEERLYINYAPLRKGTIIAWHLPLRNVNILIHFQNFFKKQNINSSVIKVTRQYSLRIYNVFDIKYILDKLAEASKILKKKIDPYMSIIKDKIKNGGGHQHLKQLQIKYIIKLYREGESIETIEKITKHGQPTISKIVKKAFNIKPKYRFLGKQVA